jgi:hypothetical protein
MSSSTEVLRHARLFAAGRLLVVHAPFSPFCGTVTLQANGAPLKDGEGRSVRRRDRIGNGIDAGKQADCAMALIFVLACERERGRVQDARLIKLNSAPRNTLARV